MVEIFNFRNEYKILFDKIKQNLYSYIKENFNGNIDFNDYSINYFQLPNEDSIVSLYSVECKSFYHSKDNIENTIWFHLHDSSYLGEYILDVKELDIDTLIMFCEWLNVNKSNLV